MSIITSKDVSKMKELFLKNYPNSRTEFKYKNLYELLWLGPGGLLVQASNWPQD